MTETINHPAHYGGDTTYEVIKVAEAWGFDKDAYLFNCLKYLGRAGRKGDAIQDLRKLVFYAERKIAALGAEIATSEAGGANEDSEAAEGHSEAGERGLRVGARVAWTRSAGNIEGTVTQRHDGYCLVEFEKGNSLPLFDHALEVIA